MLLSAAGGPWLNPVNDSFADRLYLEASSASRADVRVTPGEYREEDDGCKKVFGRLEKMERPSFGTYRSRVVRRKDGLRGREAHNPEGLLALLHSQREVPLPEDENAGIDAVGASAWTAVNDPRVQPATAVVIGGDRLAVRVLQPQKGVEVLAHMVDLIRSTRGHVHDVQFRQRVADRISASAWGQGCVHLGVAGDELEGPTDCGGRAQIEIVLEWVAGDLPVEAPLLELSLKLPQHLFLHLPGILFGLALIS